MTDYIERNELIKNLKYFAPEHYSDLINELITKQPAADVEPVKHGHWIRKYLSYGVSRYICSVCKSRNLGEDEIYFGHNKFCSVCGAKMDGENL